MLGISCSSTPTLGQIGRIKHRQEKYHEALLTLAKAASLYNELEYPYRIYH